VLVVADGVPHAEGASGAAAGLSFFLQALATANGTTATAAKRTSERANESEVV
jgi:hypothetical protein